MPAGHATILHSNHSKNYRNTNIRFYDTGGISCLSMMLTPIFFKEGKYHDKSGIFTTGSAGLVASLPGLFIQVALQYQGSSSSVISGLPAGFPGAPQFLFSFYGGKTLIPELDRNIDPVFQL
jgi:hypothetical protein